MPTRHPRTKNRFGCVLIGMLILPISAALGGEVLYNGIELPHEWPPTNIPYARKPMPVPYLETRNIPKVIPIDVGRQLLVDDFLIAKTDLARTFHAATPHEVNPVIKPDKPWELRPHPQAMAFQGGVWFDPSDQLFKAWYNCGSGRSSGGWGGLAYATSKDGIHWEKPSLDVKEGSNFSLYVQHHDGTAVWLDHNAASPEERFKVLWNYRLPGEGRWFAKYQTSPDGIHWSKVLEQPETGNDFDLFFYNPFRKVWVYHQRTDLADTQNPSKTAVGRARLYREHPVARTLIAETPKRNDDLEKTGPPKGSVYWVGADDLDPRNPVEAWADIPPQLYSLACGPYESVMLGLFGIWSGPENRDMDKPPTATLPYNNQKRVDILVGFSRDGFHWDRSSRKRFVACTWKTGDWKCANIQPVTGCCLVVGDKLYIYHSARGWYADGSERWHTGLAILRRDGFASMDAGEQAGTLTTRPVTFRGKHLFVNVDCPRGELRAEALDEDGNVIAPFSLKNSVPVKADSTLCKMTWKGGEDLSELAGKPVRFRFTLTSGSLYSFWVSPEKSGASHGYVGAGGPGFIGATDTVGMKVDQ